MLDLNNEKDMCRWLARLLDLSPSDVRDDLETMRWDVAHYFFSIGASWNAGQVVAGNMTPYTHGMKEQSHALYAEVDAAFYKNPTMEKQAFKEAFAKYYDSMNVEVIRS